MPENKEFSIFDWYSSYLCIFALPEKDFLLVLSLGLLKFFNVLILNLYISKNYLLF